MIQADALKTPRISSTDRDARLSLVRVAACVGILVLHTVFAADEYFAEVISGADHFVSRIAENNMMWAVPCFLMVTGALQLDPGRRLTLKKLYGKYILRILIALAACCLIFRIFDMIMDGEAFTAGGILMAFQELVTARCWGHLWYLYLLIGLYILMPFYRMVADRASDRELRYLALAYIAFVSVIPMIESFGLHIGFYISESVIYPLYLFLGYMIHAGRDGIPARAGALLLLAGTAAIVIMDVMRLGYGAQIPEALFGYASPAVIAQSAGVFAVLCKGRLPGERAAACLDQIDRCSFGIYLIHMIFVRSLFRYIQWNPYGHAPGLALPAAILGIGAVSFVIVWVLRRIPAVRKVL